MRRYPSNIGLSVLPRWLLPLGFIGFSLFISIYLAQLSANEDYRKLIILFVFGAAVFLATFILRNWWLGIVAFSIWLAFEDLVRKFMGNRMIIYGVKDIIVLMVYVNYFLIAWRREKVLKNSLKVPLLLCFGWALVEALNPNLDNFLVPIVGLRMTFFYVPLLFLGYAIAADEMRLKRFLTLNLAVGAIVAALGVTQAVVGLNFLNPDEASASYLRLYLTRKSPSFDVEVLRPTSTFVDAGRFAIYLFALVYLGLGFLSYLYGLAQKKGWRLRILVWLCWLTILASLFLSGQRSAILWLIFSFPVLLLAHGAQILRRQLIRSLPMAKLAVAMLALLLLAAVILPKKITAVYRFYVDTLSPTSASFSVDRELTTRPVTYWKSIVYAFRSGALLGHGTGTASLGLQYVYGAEKSEEAGIYFVEGGYAAVLWEWGVIGLGLWLWWSLVLIREVFVKVALLRGTPYYWLGMNIGLYAFFILFPWFFMGMQIYQNYVTQVFLWLAIGILFKLPTLKQQLAVSD